MYEIERLPQSIDIGFTGEMDFRTVQIDMSEWVAKMPEGQPTLMYIRPGEYDPYPVEITFEDNIVTWSVSDEDLGTKEGIGLLQVWFGVEDEEQVLRQLGMSAVVTTIIHMSLAGEGRNSSTVQIPWLKEVMEMKNIILGYDYEAESWAVGKRGGTDVPATDPAYHNNAKYYSEQASAAKTAAEAAQEAAETAAERDVVAWLAENFTNPDSPPLDRTLALDTCAAPADMVGNLKSAINTTDNTFMEFTGATDSLCIDAYENGSITANTGENSDYRKNARARTKEQTIAPFALTLAPFNTSGESTDFYVVVVSYNADGSWKETSDQIKEGSTYTIAKGQRYRLLIGDTTRQAAASVIPLSDLIAHVKVYSDFIGMIDDVEFLELSDAADGVIKTSGGDGSFSDSTVSIVKKDGVVTINGTYSASARRRVKLTGDFAQNSSLQTAWYANTEAVLPGGRVFGVEPIELGGSATISDDSYALNLLAYNTSGTLIMSAYLYADGWVINNVSSSNTDVNVGLVMLTINKDYTFSNYKISYRIIEQLANGMAYVDYTSGKDDQFGAKKFPLKTISKALSLGFRHICATPKVYNEKISLTGGEFELIPWVDDQAYDDDTAPYRPKIKLIKGTKLTVSATATTGIYQASYTASSGTNIYKVFVDHSVNPTTSGSLALEYNAMLVGDMPDTSTASKAFSPYQQRLFTPVLTEEELSAEGTFWYDDTNHLIKFHAWNDTADGEYYIPDDDADNGIALTKMDRVHLEDVKVLGFYSNCININKCDDVTVNACEVGYCAKGMGLKLDYANARVSDCHAYAISVDGFNLHGYGYSEIVGCTAFYCGDDGISHHEGCSGFIDGGEWAYNGSGGITPAFGAQIDVRNVYAHHNSIGIQWIGLGTQCRYTKMVGCLAVDNTKDVYVKWYVVYAWNNVFRVKDNVYSSARSNLIEYGTVTPE